MECPYPQIVGDTLTEYLGRIVGDVERTINCGRRFDRVSIPFKATGSETTINLSGVGSEGFGPMIDDVQITQRNPLGEAAKSLNLQRAK